MWLKRCAWFLFKSPQRNWIGVKSYWVEFKGLLSIIFLKGYRKKNSKVWICIGLKNRTEIFSNGFLKSIKFLQDKHYIALSIYGLGGEDEISEDIVRKHFQGQFILKKEDNELFSRAYAFNHAVKNALNEGAEWIFCCDADISLPVNFVKEYGRVMRKGVAWFPICQWQIEPYSAEWKWFSAGTGLAGMHKEDWMKLGGYDESFTSWGKEDWDLFFRCYKKGIFPYRNRIDKLFHHWHKSLKPADFDPMF